MNTNFLKFNGKNLLFLSKDGTYWVAIKPICEALNLEYTRQFKNLKKDEILFQLLAKQPMVGSDKKQRKMLCLPEKYIYGWLFSIKSSSKELLTYKLTCYDVLYNHFHGMITGRRDLLTKKQNVKTQIHNLKEELKGNTAFEQLMELEKETKSISKDLKNNDREILEQPKLF